MLHALMMDTEDRPLDPPDLLARLAARGVRLLDGRRYLLVDVPEELLAAQEWSELSAAASRSGSALQNLGVLVAMTRVETKPHELVDRILALPAGCLPVLIQALGGVPRLVALATEVGSEAQIDLCFAAYLQALAYQVAHDLGGDEDEDSDAPDREPGGGPEGLPGALLAGDLGTPDASLGC